MVRSEREHVFLSLAPGLFHCQPTGLGRNDDIRSVSARWRKFLTPAIVSPTVAQKHFVGVLTLPFGHFGEIAKEPALDEFTGHLRALATHLFDVFPCAVFTQFYGLAPRCPLL